MIPKFRAWLAPDMYYKPVVCDGDFYLDYRDFEDGDIYDLAVLMQSTGLTDKNGVEIFEGDVVKLGTEDLYVVEWSEREAAYKLISVDEQWSDCYFSNYENITEIIEIIGNIYENPDLVEAT